MYTCQTELTMVEKSGIIFCRVRPFFYLSKQMERTSRKCVLMLYLV